MSGEGKNESRKLKNGEKVHLVKDPDSKWQISSYECHHNVKLVGTGLVFEHLNGLPQDWKDIEFETVEDAVAFVQNEINNNKVPRNS